MTMEPAKAAQNLADILAVENDALKRMNFVDAAALVPAKEAALAQLEQQSDPSTPLPAAEVMQRIGELAAENQALLERAIAVQTRVIRIVARAYTPAGTPRYGDHGAPLMPQRPAALALSKRA